MMSAYELAKKNYPDNWSKEMLRRLVEKGRLTITEYAEIVGEPF